MSKRDARAKIRLGFIQMYDVLDEIDAAVFGYRNRLTDKGLSRGTAEMMALNYHAVLVESLIGSGLSGSTSRTGQQGPQGASVS